RATSRGDCDVAACKASNRIFRDGTAHLRDSKGWPESCIFPQLTSSRNPRMTRAWLLVAAVLIVAPTPQAKRPVRAADNAGLALQPGFCALVVAESIGPSRHMVVLENGDVLVAVSGPRGGVRVLRDTTGDGKADVVSSFGVGGGTGIALGGEDRYFATNDAV